MARVTSNALQVAADVEAASERTGPLLEIVVGKSLADVERDSKRFAPVDTGNLRSSISHDRAVDDGRTVRGEVGPTANYGAYVEFGTSRMAPQPYMAPAVERHEPAFTKAVEQIVDQAL